jgi:hypothetical protein
MSRLATRKSTIVTLRARRPPAGDREACFRGMGHSFHGSGSRSPQTKENVPLTCGYAEPPIGIEPMTYALRGARDLPAYALAAPIARTIALAMLGLSGDPVHEPVHG